MARLLRLDLDPEGVPLAGDCINCILICSLFWEQFMIVTETSVDTMCMYVVMVGFTIAPLLEDVLHND